VSVIARPASIEAGLVFSPASLLTAVLVFAPLIKGGNRPLPLLLLELAAVALLIMLALRPVDVLRQVSRPMLIAIAAMVALPLLQLVPLPDWLWSVLPGRAEYAAAMKAIGIGSEYRSLTLLPRATEESWLTLLPPVAVFLTAISLPDEKLKTLVHLFLGMAVVQALISLGQYGTGSVAVLWYVEGLHDRSGMGTYANRDHLAGLLEMAFPIGLALLAANIHRARQRRSAGQKPKRLRLQLAAMFAQEGKVNRIAILAAACLAMLVGLVFSRSRTGLALGMLAILICTAVFARRLGGKRSLRIITILFALAIAIAAEVGLTPVLGRFTQQNIASDVRWSIYSGTMTGIGAFFPAGSGLGTFPDVFRRFQLGDIDAFVNHAHDDYLEWLFEGGVFAAALIIAFAAFYVRRWPHLWRAEHWSRLRFVQIAAGISLFLLGLHGLVDFNLHIPANAIYFAFIAALFFHEAQETPLPIRGRRLKPVPDPASQPAVTMDSSDIPLDGPNPFAK
jgi:O-antigen ligase